MPGKKVDRRNSNGTPSAAIAKDMLRKTGVLLALIGKPFYLLLGAFLIALLFLFTFVGKIIVVISKEILFAAYEFTKTIKKFKLPKYLSLILDLNLDLD